MKDQTIEAEQTELLGLQHDYTILDEEAERLEKYTDKLIRLLIEMRNYNSTVTADAIGSYWRKRISEILHDD